MTNDCPLLHWTTNSRIDHAVATKINGPFTFKDVAISTFSHNPAPVRLKDGLYAIFHIGNGDGPIDGGKDCTNATAAVTTTVSRRAQNERTSTSSGGSTIHISASLWGPWIPLYNHNLGNCNNPSPWVHPNNGTIYVACTDGYIRKSDSIRGPYIIISKFPLSPMDASNSTTPIVYEDPQLYTDQRGNYHILYHAYQRIEPSNVCENSIVSAHAYSKDGYTWYTSSTPPYTAQIKVITDNTTTTTTLASRERPKPILDSKGRMTHLVEGVCGSPNCITEEEGMKPWCVHCKYRQWDYTLVSILRTQQ
jgi:hypothetical protein